MNRSDDLIDTTEMYLRSVLELEEEGMTPLRARIAERLGQSVPTVSQTVARMQRDGLLTVTGDRRIQLTPHGRDVATRVMRMTAFGRSPASRRRGSRSVSDCMGSPMRRTTTLLAAFGI